MDPAVWWRRGLTDPAPPEPWPGRVDAFLTACALQAGDRERDIYSIVEAFAQGPRDG